MVKLANIHPTEHNYSAVSTYNPWFVQEVVDGVERIESGDCTIGKPENDVLPILTRISHMLSYQHKVWLE